MKTIKNIGLALLMTVIGFAVGLGYQYLTGDISGAELWAELKSTAGTIFVSIGGTGGVLALGGTLINRKINEFKIAIEQMESESAITTENATMLKNTADEFNTQIQGVITKQSETIDNLITENQRTNEISEKLNSQVTLLLEKLQELAEE